jgi:chromosome partitioning protein
MHTLAIANHKGGVGKTTTAVNLAACLAEAGRSVLLIDCDPPAAASGWLAAELPAGAPRLEQVFAGEADLAAAAQPTAIAGLTIVPTSPALAVQDRLLYGSPAPAAVLARALRGWRGIPFDYVLLDSPPQLGMLACNVLAAADRLLIPVCPDPLSVAALDELFRTVATIREWLNPHLGIAGILLTRVRARTRLGRDVAADVAARYPGLVLPVAIRETVRAAEAPSLHLPIGASQPRSPIAADYRWLARLLFPGEIAAAGDLPAEPSPVAAAG